MFPSFGKLESQGIEYPYYWSSSRTYTYIVSYTDSLNQKISVEKLSLQPTEINWSADTHQTLLNFKLDSISADWSKIPSTPLNGIQRQWMNAYQEGVLQTKHKVWMHPLRQNQYILTELAPFPEILLPIKSDTTWQSTLYIYKTFGLFEGTVESIYRITKQEERSYLFGKIWCWKIEAVGMHSRLGKNFATYYFNERYGFTEMNYKFYNHESISIKLSQLKE